jgi:hypothetical protein
VWRKGLRSQRLQVLLCRFFLTGVIPVSESLGMYLQADKPFSSSSFHIIPPEELSALAAEHEAAPEGPIKR